MTYLLGKHKLDHFVFIGFQKLVVEAIFSMLVATDNLRGKSLYSAVVVGCRLTADIVAEGSLVLILNYHVSML